MYVETNFCERGHQVWWADLNGENTAFVRFTGAYRLQVIPETGTRGRVVAAEIGLCYRKHRDICPSRSFRPSNRELRQANREEKRRRKRRFRRRQRYVPIRSGNENVD